MQIYSYTYITLATENSQRSTLECPSRDPALGFSLCARVIRNRTVVAIQEPRYCNALMSENKEVLTTDAAGASPGEADASVTGAPPKPASDADTSVVQAPATLEAANAGAAIAAVAVRGRAAAVSARVGARTASLVTPSAALVPNTVRRL